VRIIRNVTVFGSSVAASQYRNKALSPAGRRITGSWLAKFCWIPSLNITIGHGANGAPGSPGVSIGELVAHALPVQPRSLTAMISIRLIDRGALSVNASLNLRSSSPLGSNSSHCPA